MRCVVYKIGKFYIILILSGLVYAAIQSECTGGYERVRN